MPKLNCWEFTDCGRQPGGKHVPELGACPVPLEVRLDGTHEGTNAGRCCWVVAGTLCEGKVQGTYGEKFYDCRECGFYKTVKNEEWPEFQVSAVLREKISRQLCMKMNVAER